METMNSAQLAQLLYVAYYGRPADKAGQQFWADQIDAVGTAGVAADFGATAEFTARFGELSNEELVQNLYQQLFSRDGEQAGVDYWVNLLENGTTLADIALEIANGAQNDDITAINSKVAVAQRFTDLAGEEYTGDAAANSARDFMLTVNAETDAEAVDVQAAIDALVEAPASGLTEDLSTLKTAQDAKAEFLFNYAQDPEVEGEEAPAVDADVTGALTAAAQNVEDMLVDVAAGNQFVESSAAVRSAMIADQQEANAEALTKAQANLEKAQADVAQVTGLTQAVNNLKAAQEAEKEAGEAVTEARATLNSTVASYNTFNDAAPIAAVNADGTVDGLIELNAKGNLVLVAGVSEEDNKGITAVLNASIAKEEADAALVDAQEATGAAQDVVDNLDLSEAAVAKLEEVAAAMTVVELAEGALPSPGQIQSEIAGLEALVATAEASADTDAVLLRADADAAAAADLAEQTDAVQLRTDADAAAAADLAEQTDAVQLRADADAAATLQSQYEAAQTDAAAADGTADNSGDSTTDLAAIKTAFSNAQGVLQADIDTVNAATTDQGALDLIAGFVVTYTQAAIDADAAATAAEQNDQAAVDALVGSSFATVTEAAAADAAALDSSATAAEQDDQAAVDALVGSSFATVTEAAAADAAALEAEAAAAEQADVGVVEAQQNLADFEALVGQYNTLADENPLLTALTNAEEAISNDAETGIQDQIDALAKAVADLQEAQGDVAELNSLNDAIEAAEQTFLDNDFLVPVTLEEGANLATADSDIFLVGEAEASTISNFGLLGDDALFIGSDYTLNTGDIETDGDNSVLEVFFTQDGANTIISLETEVFGSNSTDAEQTITLTGVSVDQLNFEGGLITIVEAA